MYVYMPVCLFACLSGCMDVCMNVCLSVCNGCMDVWMYGCMDAWMHGCMDAWMHGCMYVCMLIIHRCVHIGVRISQDRICMYTISTKHGD